MRPRAEHTIDLSSTGHTELERDELIVTVPVNYRDIATLADIDGREDEVG